MAFGFLDVVAGLCVAAVFYHFVGYPLGLSLMARRVPPRLATAIYEPSIALIIAAYNEERVIEAKIRNSLSLSYPKAKLSIVVVSDGSADSTPQITETFAAQGVVSLFSPERQGKSHALNRAVLATDAEILVFSDANNEFSTDALRLLVSALADTEVGGVSGAKRVIENRMRAASVGDSLYWRYESQIKTAEGKLGGTVSADGEVFAMRRSLYRAIPPHVINDDAFLTLAVVDQGFQVGYEPKATAVEEGSYSIAEDFRVKVRMIAGGFQFVAENWKGILKHGVFAFKFASHKLLRWIMPMFLLILFGVSLLRATNGFYQVILVAQFAFYGLALVGALAPSVRGRSKLVYIPYYFVVMNFAAFRGMQRFLMGSQSVLWSKAAR